MRQIFVDALLLGLSAASILLGFVWNQPDPHHRSKNGAPNLSMSFLLHAMMQDEQVQELYEQIPKVSARHPHVLEFELGFATAADAFAVEGLRTSLEIAPMQKLSHKVLQDDFFLALLHPLSKPTLLSALTCSAFGDRITGSLLATKQRNMFFSPCRVQKQKRLLATKHEKTPPNRVGSGQGYFLIMFETARCFVFERPY